jgi:hypothetical protein
MLSWWLKTCRVLCLFYFAMAAQAAEKPEVSNVYAGQGVEVHAHARTPDQMTAFYAGRGFPAAMLEPISHVCFLTVSLRHVRQDVVWLEPSRWRILDADGNNVQRLDRDFWNRVWETMQAPPASRATFGWTQLPESRDLQPGEPVGGNITIAPPNGVFNLELHFATGPDKKGPEIIGRIEGLVCHDRTTGQGGEVRP